MICVFTMKVEQLATIILQGPLESCALLSRLECVLLQHKFSKKLAKRLVKSFGAGTRPSFRAVILWLEADKKFHKKREKGALKYRPMGESEVNPEMEPDRRISVNWKMPSICTLGALSHWLDLSANELDWFSGMMGEVDSGSKLSHYHIISIAKKRGGTRILEAPKWRLKQIQRFILHGILDQIPAHPCSHGFQKNRSIITYVQPHVGKKLVIKFDLKDYFLTVDRARVRSLFHIAGYPPLVSRSLAGICTHAVRIPYDHSSAQKYREPHLPQGAPSSPARPRLAPKMP